MYLELDNPVLERTDSIEHDQIIYTLRVPHYWYMKVDYPRIRLAWWLIKLVFQRKQ